MAHHERVRHPGWRRRALIAAACAAMLPVNVWPSQAKAPGATWCFRDVCHRVRTVGETQRLVGKTMVLEASYYDEPRLDRFNKGKHTSNGELFDANNPARVAAANFPDGTELLLRNPENGRTSHVRVNDFGPFLRTRLLDVTKRVAQDLDFARLGITKLEVTVIAAPPPEEVVYRKNRISLPTHGHLGTLEAAEATDMARALIAAAQDSAPTVASTVPQTERTTLSAAGLLARYDLLGRVRAILGLPRPQPVADLEREVIAAGTIEPETAQRHEPASEKVAMLAAEPAPSGAPTAPDAMSDATRAASGGTTEPPAKAELAMLEPVATISQSAALSPAVAATATAALAVPVAMSAPEPMAPPLTAIAADLQLGADETSRLLDLPRVPQMGAFDSQLQAALMSESVTPGFLATASVLADQMQSMAHGVLTMLGGSMPAQTNLALLLLLATLGTALLFASRHGKLQQPVAAAARSSMTGFLPSLRLERAGASETPVQVAPVETVAPRPAAVPMPAVQGSHIGPDITVLGDVTSRGTLTVSGLVRGRVTADTLVILEQGRIEGPVEARIVRCAGSIESSMSVSELYLASTAHCRGEIAVATLSMELGATLDADISRRPAAG